MKPIKEDIVIPLIRHPETRPDIPVPGLDPATFDAGSMTARVLAFRPGEGVATRPSGESAAVLNLPRARRARAAARTTSGLFVYAARL